MALDGVFERRSERTRRFFIARKVPVRAKTAEDRKLLELLEPVVEAQGFELVRLRLMGGSATGRTLQIMAERPSDGDLGIDDCVRLSRAVSEVMEAADPISGEYHLEVSSPGIDRPLTRPKDFEAYAGLEAKIELDRLADKRKRFKGVLVGIEDVQGQPHVALDVEGEAETALISFAWIQDAKLTLSDALMKRGAEKRALRLAEQGLAEQGLAEQGLAEQDLAEQGLHEQAGQNSQEEEA